MRNDFQKIKLGQLCTLRTGGTPKTSERCNYEGGTINWVVSGDVNKKQIWDCESKITEKGMNSSNAKLLPKDSVLIALNGQGKTRGTVAMLRVPATCNQSIVCMIPRDTTKLDVEYLYHYLNSIYKQIRQLTGDTDRRGLNMPILRSIDIPLPPLSEQKRIVAVLDKADKIRRKREKAIELTDSFLRSVFLDMFGDENSVSKFPLKRFAEIGVEIIDGDRGKEYPSGDQLQQQGHCLFLSTKNVSKTGFSFEACQFIDEERDSKLRKGKLKRQDVVFTTRGTLGNVAFFNDEVPFNHVRINSGMVIFRCQTSDFSPALLYYLLRSPIIKRQLARHQSGTAQPQIPIRSLSTFQLPVPPRSLQDELGERLIAIDRLRLKHENALTISRALSESISARLFSNEVIHPRSEERQEAVHAL